MLKIFKGISAAYFTVAVIGGVIIGWCMESLPEMLVLAVLWALGAGIIAEIIAQAKYMKMTKQHNEHCQIEGFLAFNESIAHKVKDKSLKFMVSLNLFAGYFALGEYYKASQVISAMSPIKGKGINPTIANVTYYNHLSSIYAKENKFEEAEAALNKADELALGIKNLYKEKRTELIKLNNHNRICLNVDKGDFEGAEMFFTMELKTEKMLLMIVDIYYYLTKCYVQKGDIEKAKECCNYVIEKGGNTYYVTECKKILENF